MVLFIEKNCQKGKIDKMIKYSVIMPVYNAEIFLDKNLLLFKNLKRKDVELLIINDGSND